MWIIDTAKEWPESLFVRASAHMSDSAHMTFHVMKVGFDLVNVQVPLNLLESSIAERITWMYGNL
jgi:hypothetical protein